MNAMNRFARLATATGCLLWIGAAVAQAGGPSNGYSGTDTMPAPSRQNTPSTGGGPTTQAGKSARDEASTDRSARANSSMSDDAPGKATAMSEGMIGTISKLDRDNKTIELEGDRRLHVDPTTEIRRDGKTASFSDLQEGDDVRASFQGDDRSNVKRIEVLSGNSSSSGSSSSGSTSGSSSSTGR